MGLAIDGNDVHGIAKAGQSFYALNSNQQNLLKNGNNFQSGDMISIPFGNDVFKEQIATQIPSSSSDSATYQLKLLPSTMSRLPKDKYFVIVFNVTLGNTTQILYNEQWVSDTLPLNSLFIKNGASYNVNFREIIGETSQTVSVTLSNDASSGSGNITINWFFKSYFNHDNFVIWIQ